MSPEIMNVSAMGGFAFADAPECGLSVVVTARHDKRAAETLAHEIAELGWANRARFYPRLTSLDEAVAKALAVGRDASLSALAFADVADVTSFGLIQHFRKLTITTPKERVLEIGLDEMTAAWRGTLDW